MLRVSVQQEAPPENQAGAVQEITVLALVQTDTYKRCERDARKSVSHMGAEANPFRPSSSR